MKRVIILLNAIICMLFMNTSFAEGILPSMEGTVGKALPSLSDAIQRFPDTDTENEDGSSTEVYLNVSEDEFDLFSLYLLDKNVTLGDYQVVDGVFQAEIVSDTNSFTFKYNSLDGTAEVFYPKGTYNEYLKAAKVHYSEALQLLSEEKWTEAIGAFNKISGYKDSAKLIEETKEKIYEQAKKLLKSGDVLGAKQGFMLVYDYKDSRDQLDTISGKYDRITTDGFDTVGIKPNNTVVATRTKYQNKGGIHRRCGLNHHPWSSSW